jgi:hypothetical protein
MESTLRHAAHDRDEDKCRGKPEEDYAEEPVVEVRTKGFYGPRLARVEQLG